MPSERDGPFVISDNTPPRHRNNELVGSLVLGDDETARVCEREAIVRWLRGMAIVFATRPVGWRLWQLFTGSIVAGALMFAADAIESRKHLEDRS